MGLFKRVTGLKENVVYEAKVIAFSEYGASAPSYTVDIATRGK